MRKRPPPPWLAVMLLTALVLYTDDYVIAGILPDISADLNVSEEAAGQLVTAFSLTVALSAPSAAVLLAGVRRSRLFTVVLGAFAAVNVAAACAPHFAVLLALRVLAALCTGAVTPAVFSWTAAQAPPAKVGRYVAVVAMGVTGAIALGVPVGITVAHAAGWRANFLVLGAAAVVCLLAVRAAMPSDPRGEPAASPLAQLRAVASRPVATALVGNLVAISGSMMALTYLAPYLASVHPGQDLRAVAFAASGAAGVAGVLLGGVLADRLGPRCTLLLGAGILTGGLAGAGLLAVDPPAPASVLIAVVAAQAFGAFVLSPSLTSWYFTVGGDGAESAVALNTSGTYLGVAVAGALGGWVLATGGPGVVPLAATGCALAALAAFAAAGWRTSP